MLRQVRLASVLEFPCLVVSNDPVYIALPLSPRFGVTQLLGLCFREVSVDKAYDDGKMSFAFHSLPSSFPGFNCIFLSRARPPPLLWHSRFPSFCFGALPVAFLIKLRLSSSHNCSPFAFLSRASALLLFALPLSRTRQWGSCSTVTHVRETTIRSYTSTTW